MPVINEKRARFWAAIGPISSAYCQWLRQVSNHLHSTTLEVCIIHLAGGLSHTGGRSCYIQVLYHLVVTPHHKATIIVLNQCWQISTHPG